MISRKVGRIPVLLSVLLTVIAAPFSHLATAESGQSKGPTVVIGPNYVGVPYGRILLARKESTHCAIRYMDYRESRKGFSARYESFYQGDGTGNFTKENVEYTKSKVSNLGLRNFLGSHYWKGDLDLKCGPISLMFGAGPKGGGVHFFGSAQHQQDYGIELAATPWTSVAEIDVSDAPIVWYRFNSRRPDRIIPIGELWPENSTDVKDGKEQGTGKRSGDGQGP